MSQIKISKLQADFLPFMVGFVTIAFLRLIGMNFNELSTWIVFSIALAIYLIIRFKYITVKIYSFEPVLIPFNLHGNEKQELITKTKVK